MPRDSAAAYVVRAMAHGEASNEDRGRCTRCGGRITATHMLTKSYEVGEDGRWRRRLDDFAEDLVIVCADCGSEPEGKFEADGERFAFMPEQRHRDGEGGRAEGRPRLDGAQPDR